MEAPILFVDFDGVLRRLHGPPDQLEAALVTNLETFMRRFSRLQGVFSTSWRLYNNLDQLRARLPAPLRARFIATTPELIQHGMASRHSEILAWRRAAGHRGVWVAIDDRPAEFPDHCAQLCVCDPHRGFDHETLERCAKQLLGLTLERLARRAE